MNALKDVMSIIDKNAHSLPEGDYLRICNALNMAYKRNEGYPYIFNHQEQIVNADNEDQHSSDYFLNYYVECAISVEQFFIEQQIDSLLRLRDMYKPLKRISKNVKEKAIQHYCIIHNIDDIEDNEGALKEHLDRTGYVIGDGSKPFTEAVNIIYRSYMDLENQFRRKCIRLIDDRIKSLDWKIDELDQM